MVYGQFSLEQRVALARNWYKFKDVTKISEQLNSCDYSIVQNRKNALGQLQGLKKDPIVEYLRDDRRLNEGTWINGSEANFIAIRAQLSSALMSRIGRKDKLYEQQLSVEAADGQQAFVNALGALDKYLADADNVYDRLKIETELGLLWQDRAIE